MKISELNDAIAAVCPIEGINSDGDIWFKQEATDAQKQAARSLMDTNLPTIDLLPSHPVAAPAPTLSELQTQLATLTTQINALVSGAKS